MCSLQHYLADVGISCVIVLGMVLLLLPFIMYSTCQVFLTSLSLKLAAHNISGDKSSTRQLVITSEI